MKKTSTVQLVRNATLKIRYAGHTMLIDPVLADKGTLISALGVNKTPRVHLTIPIQDIIGGVDMVLLTHNHIDHYEPSVPTHLPKEIPFYVPAPGRGRHQKRRIYKCDTHRRNKNNRRHIHLPHDRTSWFRADRADDGTCIRLCAKSRGLPDRLYNG